MLSSKRHVYCRINTIAVSLLASLLVFAASGSCQTIIKSATLSFVSSHSSWADLWPNTWAADDSLFFAHGDGTSRGDCIPSASLDEESPHPIGWFTVDTAVSCDAGQFKLKWPCAPEDGCTEPGNLTYCDHLDCDVCLPLCTYTDFGLARLTGRIESLDSCTDDSCVVALHLPADPNTPWPTPLVMDDKPSSLLAIGDTLYLAGHWPPGIVLEGYLATSTDNGDTWNEQPSSPWVGISSPPYNGSNFRVPMFIQMGKDYEFNKDGFVYALGIAHEFPVHTLLANQPVYLARVPTSDVGDYAKYEYFKGIGNGNKPLWTPNEDEAIPVTGLETGGQASAMYHHGIKRYIFFTGVIDFPDESCNLPETPPCTPFDIDAGLFEARQPWGPWTRVQTFINQGGYLASLIAKDAGRQEVFFAAAGGSTTYGLNIGQISFERQ
jgi:hypothetical protein